MAISANEETTKRALANHSADSKYLIEIPFKLDQSKKKYYQRLFYHYDISCIQLNRCKNSVRKSELYK